MEYAINKVAGFNPFDYIETAKDRRGNAIVKPDGKPLQYMTTAAKVLWFRKVYPKGILMTEQLETPEKEFGQIVSFRALVLTDNDTLLAEWTHQETCWDIAELDNIVARVQTIALGKALSKAGFGCEVEMILGAMSEGEMPEVPEEVIEEAPKKKRGRPPKKEEKSDEALHDEVENLIAQVESSIVEESAEEPVETTAPASDDDVDARVEKALEMPLTLTEDPNVKVLINIKTMAGDKLGDILACHKDFGKMVKKNAKYRKMLSKECADALVFIEEHKM